ncbi:MAG: hypothetical protein MRZ79_24820 [Bacteroidia bacterium]|nr:hypothetical protein [Bacteroidia bacterium]
MKTFLKIFIVAMGLAVLASPLFAQDDQRINSNKLSIMTGLSQPFLLNGVNLAFTYTTDKLYFEYSHGAFLNYHNFGKAAMKAADRENFDTQVAPFSTGGGVGYRFNSNGQIFWEFKVHQYDLKESSTGNEISYKTFEMGPALSYRLFLDKEKKFFFEPVARYWFHVASFGNEGLDGRQIALTRADNSSFTHTTFESGFFLNMSLGFVVK